MRQLRLRSTAYRRPPDIRKSGRISSGLTALILSTAWSQVAGAQSIGPVIQEPDDVPGTRIIAGFSPIGYDFQGFHVLPSVTFGAGLDSNVFSRKTVRESDVVVQSEPRLRVRREGRFSSIAFDAVARTNTYLRLSDQDSTEYRFDGTYTRGTVSPDSISVNVNYRREAVLRGTVENDLIGGEPLMRRVLGASITGRKQFNRVSIDGQAIAGRQRYEDIENGGAERIDQSFRNVVRYGARGVLSYQASSRTSIFTGIEYDRFDYARSPLLENRDATNWSGTAGLRYELSRVLVAQLGVGYRSYNFTDPQLGAIKGLALSGHLRYFPSRLVALRGVIEQSNTTSPYDLVGAVTLTSARVEIEYEMRRSLSWNASTKVTLEDYAHEDYSAGRYEISAGPRFRFNRWLSANANVGFTKRFVNGPAPFDRYSKVVAVLSVTLAR